MVQQTGVSNPSFDVIVNNAGSWKMTSIKARNFRNRNSLTLSGQNRTIAPVAGQASGVFLNDANGRVVFDQAISDNSCTVSTQYRQARGGVTSLEEGTMDLGFVQGVVGQMCEVVEADGIVALGDGMLGKLAQLFSYSIPVLVFEVVEVGEDDQFQPAHHS